MSTPVNILLGLIGVSGVNSGLSSVRQGLANVNAEALRASASAIGLAQFATAAGAAAAAVAGVKQALDFGGQLSDLSARTGESVRDLVVLERAFDNAGIGAANVARVFTLLQRAVSGFNEQGERTDTTLSRLGTSSARLRDLSARDQIAELTRGFAALSSQADRAALATQLFGREGGQMLQLFGDGTALATAADEVGALADRMERNAASFDEAGDRLSLIKARVMEMAAATTEELLPALDAAANLIKALDLGGAGAVVGGVLPSAAVAAALTGVMAVVDRLDDRLVTATLKAGPGMAQSIGFALTNLTGLLARILPVGLAGAVFYGIYSGAISAWQASINERDRLAEEAHRKEKARVEEIAAMRTSAEQAALRERIVAEMQALEARRDELITIRTWDVDSRSSTPDAVEQRPRGFTTEEDGTYRRLQGELRVIDGERAKQIIRANQLADASAAELEAANKISAELASQVKSHQDAAEKARFSLADDERKLTLLDEAGRKAAAQRADDRLAATIAGDSAAAAAAEARFEAATLQIALERKNTQERIAESKEREKKAAEAAAKAEEQAAAAARQRAQLAARNDLEQRQLQIQRDLMALDADYSRTDAEKWRERRTQLEAAVDAARAYRDTMQADRDANPGDSGAQTNLMGAQQGLLQAEGSLAGLGADPSSFLEQMKAGLAGLRAEWGTTAQAMATAMTGAMQAGQSALGSFLYDGLFGAKSWGEAWDAATLQLGRQFGQLATEMVAKMIWRSTIERGLVALGVTTHVTGEAAKTTASATGTATRLGLIVKEALASVYKGAVQAFEALSSIPYVGPILGAAAMAAAIAGGIALVGKIAGHADGGLISGPGGPRDDAILARLSNGEYVNTADTVGRFGPGFFRGLDAGVLDLSAVPDDVAVRASSPAAVASAGVGGGGGGFSGAPESPRNTHIYLDRSAWLEAVRNDLTGIAHEVYDKRERS